MRPALILLPLLAVSASAPGQPVASEHYVPETGWSRDMPPGFYEDWFGGELRAMGEPVLNGPGRLGDFRRRFRLLSRASRGLPVAVRIDERRDGRMEVRVVHFSNVAVSRAWISSDAHFVLSGEDARRLARAIRASGLKSARRQLLPRPDKGNQIRLCLHPATYVFELVDEAGPSFVYRDECAISPGLKRLARTVDSLVERPIG